MKISNSITDRFGGTPMVGLQRLTEGLDCELIGKLESRNPGNSVKDSPGHPMIVTISCDTDERYLSTPLFAFK